MNTSTVPSVFKDAAFLAVLCAVIYVALLYTPRTKKITQSLGSYTFIRDGSSFSLYANGSEKYFLFTSKEIPKINTEQKIIGNTMTITYGKDAIIVEGTSNLITENSESIRSLLEQEIGNTLIPNNPEIRTLSISTIGLTLIHPDIPGRIRITLPSQNTTIINKDERSITIHGEIYIDVLPTYSQI